MSQADSFHSLGIEEKRDHFAILASNMHSILSFLDTLEVKEKPVSKDLEKAAHKYIHGNYSPWLYSTMHDCFKAGAEWQKEQRIDKITEWLCHNYDKYIRVIGSSVYPAYAELCKDFQKAMEE